MDNRHLTQGDTIQDTVTENITVDREPEYINIVLNVDSVPGSVSASNIHLTGSNGIEAHDGRSSVLPFMVQLRSQGSPAHYPYCRSRAYMQCDNEHQCINPRNDSDEILLPLTSEEIPSSEFPVIAASKYTSTMYINDSDVKVPVFYSQESPLSRPRAASATSPRNERGGKADPDDPLNYTQMPYTELDLVYDTGLTRLTQEIREEFDTPCEDLPSSQPPSSSPLHLLSSSPCASSQSSVSGVEPFKMVPIAETVCSAGSDDCPHVAFQVARDEYRLEYKLLDHDTVDVADKYFSEISPTSCVEGSPRPSKKRIAHQSEGDESYGSQPVKRPKPDPPLYVPPAPMRATLASQDRQFKKLSAPFRPPSKLPVVRGELAQTLATSKRAIDSACSSMPEIDHDKPHLKEFTTTLQPNASNYTSRSVTQFKSPLVNWVLPADSRTIRLTPALQALERRLQLLKRAIKVKEDNEGEVLGRLTEKWIAAGREVAYDVWDATKDAGDFGGKATLFRKSYGWKDTNDGNSPQGWVTKVGDAGKETCGLDPSTTGCIAAEEDDNIGSNNTLGSMLRQLGIAPEIFGWDDDKEAFSD